MTSNVRTYFNDQLDKAELSYPFDAVLNKLGGETIFHQNGGIR
jgi:hypothetical protein